MSSRKSMSVDVEAGQCVRLLTVPVDSGEIVITLESKSGKRARIRIDAPDSVKIRRPPERTKVPTT